MRPRYIRILTLTTMVFALAFLTAVIVIADDNVDSSKYDGRLNVAAWIGGNAVYCVDKSWSPTSDGWSDGGIRILDGNGQAVFFASAAEIDAVGVPTENTLVKSEAGFSLYRQPDGGFSLNGVDQWGSPYTFVFQSCVPIGPVPYTHASIPQPCVPRKPAGFASANIADDCNPK